MLLLSQIRLPVDHSDDALRRAAAAALGAKPESIREVKVKQRAVDARKRGEVQFCYTLLVEVADEAAVLARSAKPGHVELALDETYHAPKHDTHLEAVTSESDIPPSAFRLPPSQKPRIVIVGTGPCGIFCGLILAREGFKPLLLERGKAVGPRARDVTGFWRRGLEFNADSNVQFGEGGAGTFSDGKLYTQIRDREHRIPWLLREMVKAGAPADILIKSRPHVGTDRLARVVRTIRDEIISLGGEVRFETRVADVVIENGAMREVVTGTGETIEADRFIFAVGHSSRDTFEALHARGVPFEAKPFSVGVRIEHPQSLVDHAQFGRWAGDARLGAAAYKFVTHTRTGRAAYSFCMCPGGLVVASNSEPGMVVTNGMSSYARAESNANAGFMVDVKPEDFASGGVLGGIALQRDLERRAFAAGGSNYKAPAQLLGDFLKGRASTGAGQVTPSYLPGVTWGNLHDLLPSYVCETLRAAVPMIEKQLRGFAQPDAVMTGVETRSSSPIRIPREPDTLECIGIRHFYPAGEGAGYAGGIISAAVDGMRVAEALL